MSKYLDQLKKDMEILRSESKPKMDRPDQTFDDYLEKKDEKISRSKKRQTRQASTQGNYNLEEPPQGNMFQRLFNPVSYSEFDGFDPFKPQSYTDFKGFDPIQGTNYTDFKGFDPMYNPYDAPNYDLGNKLDSMAGSFRLNVLQKKIGEERAKQMDGKPNELDKVKEAFDNLLSKNPGLAEDGGFSLLGHTIGQGLGQVPGMNQGVADSLGPMFAKGPEGVAGMAPIMGQGMLEFGKAGAIGGAGAGMMAGLLGQAGPQALMPEEILTVPGAFAGGFNTAGTMASTKYIYDVERGLMFDELLTDGIPEDTAKKWAILVGAVNAGLEVAQIKDIARTIPGADKFLQKLQREGIKKIAKGKGLDTLKSFVKNMGSSVPGSYAKHIATETSQEVAQDMTGMIGRYGAEKEVGRDPRLLTKENAKQLLETASSSAVSFAILGGPGHLMQGAKNLNINKVMETRAKIRDIHKDEIDLALSYYEINPEALKDKKAMKSILKTEESIRKAMDNGLYDDATIGHAMHSLTRIKALKDAIGFNDIGTEVAVRKEVNEWYKSEYEKLDKPKAEQQPGPKELGEGQAQLGQLELLDRRNRQEEVRHTLPNTQSNDGSIIPGETEDPRAFPKYNQMIEDLDMERQDDYLNKEANTYNEKIRKGEYPPSYKEGDVLDYQGTKYKVTGESQGKIEVVNTETGRKSFIPKGVNLDLKKDGRIEETLSMEERNNKNVSDRKVKAYQFEHPEVKPFYQARAKELLNELKQSVKGERRAVENENGEFINQSTKRFTSDSLAFILDGENTSYKKVEDALNRIINDKGQENIALAKRIEQIIDEDLVDGYTSIGGAKVDPSNDYIQVRNSIEKNKIADHARKTVEASDLQHPVEDGKEFTNQLTFGMPEDQASIFDAPTNEKKTEKKETKKEAPKNPEKVSVRFGVDGDYKPGYEVISTRKNDVLVHPTNKPKVKEGELYKHGVWVSKNQVKKGTSEKKETKKTEPKKETPSNPKPNLDTLKPGDKVEHSKYGTLEIVNIGRSLVSAKNENGTEIRMGKKVFEDGLKGDVKTQKKAQENPHENNLSKLSDEALMKEYRQRMKQFDENRTHKNASKYKEMANEGLEEINKRQLKRSKIFTEDMVKKNLLKRYKSHTQLIKTMENKNLSKADKVKATKNAFGIGGGTVVDNLGYFVGFEDYNSKGVTYKLDDGRKFSYTYDQIVDIVTETQETTSKTEKPNIIETVEQFRKEKPPVVQENHKKCYEVAFKHQQENGGLLTYGQIEGLTNDDEIGRINHAWVDYGNYVYEPQYDRYIGKSFYENQLEPKIQGQFTQSEAKKLFKSGKDLRQRAIDELKNKNKPTSKTEKPKAEPKSQKPKKSKRKTKYDTILDNIEKNLEDLTDFNSDGWAMVNFDLELREDELIKHAKKNEYLDLEDYENYKRKYDDYVAEGEGDSKEAKDYLDKMEQALNGMRLDLQTGLADMYKNKDKDLKKLINKLYTANKVGEKKETSTPKTEKTTEQVGTEQDKIEDFGEKIGGARKDLWQAQRDLEALIEGLDTMTDREAIKLVTKDKIWKKPDYEKWVEDGIDVEVAYLYKKVRDSLPAKVDPTTDEAVNKKNRIEYMELLSQVREVISNIDNVNDFTKLREKILLENGYIEKGTYSWNLTEKARNNINFTNRFLKAVQISNWDIQKAKRKIEKTGWPKKIPKWKKGYDIHKIGDDTTFTITKGHRIIEEGFKTKAEAEKYLKANNKNTKGNQLQRPQLKNIRRTGEDHRKSRNVTTEEFREVFGFRGGEFGNWNNQADRQANLNHAYDALMDLAMVLQVDPKAISLNGELGIAFGARGKGKASAHYEPSKIVINLTKMKGAGSLAHEWGHALDDYFARMSGELKPGEYVSEARFRKLEGLRKEVRNAFSNIIDTMQKVEMTDQEMIESHEAQLKRSSRNLETWLDKILPYLEKEQETYGNKKNRRKATEKELKAIKKHLEAIREGGEKGIEAFEKLNKLHKSIKGIMLDAKTREAVPIITRHIGWSKDGIEKIKAGGETKRTNRTSDYVKNAKEIDKGRSKAYWSTNVELFARAFESYVQDKLGFKSDYLVHSTKKNNEYMEYKPYPEGKEREAINEAFENFVDTLEEKYNEDVNGERVSITKEDYTKAKQEVLELEAKAPNSKTAREHLKQARSKLIKMNVQLFGQKLDYDMALDRWFGNKDIKYLKNSVGITKMQDKIKAITGEKRYGKASKKMDMAIQVYIDLIENGQEMIGKYYKDLTDEQKEIVDLSKNLPKEAVHVAEEILHISRMIGEEALDAGAIRNLRDNHLSRFWKKEGKGKRGAKFGTKTGLSKQRTLESILEGWSKGKELNFKGATGALGAQFDELTRTIEDKKLVETLLNMEDEDGNPLITTYRREGYVAVDHPNFTKWMPANTFDPIEFVEWKGRKGDRVKVGDSNLIGRVVALKDGDMAVVQFKNGEEVYELEAPRNMLMKVMPSGQNFFISDNGIVYERKTLYMPEDKAKFLNNILGDSVFYKEGFKAVKAITKFNAYLKNWILQTSLFHHLAFMRSYYLGTNGKNFDELNVFSAYREGLRAIGELKPEIELLVRNGLTIGRIQEWDEKMIMEEKTWLGNKLDKHKATKAVKDKITDLREKQAHFLFNEFGAGLKAKAGIIELRHMLEKHPDKDPNEVAKMVANLINDDFGGLHLERMGRNKTKQHIFRLGFLAPDWTESNVRTMVKSVGLDYNGGWHKISKEEKALYRRFWSHAITKGMASTVVANFVMSLFDEKDFLERYKTAWKQGNLKWLEVDITPLYRALGGDSYKRKYFSLIGHFKDPVKFVTHPIRSFHHKGSVFYRTIHEAITGTDWRGRQFTTTQELLGLTMDDSNKGQLTKWGSGGALEYNQIPSYLLHQVVSNQPVQVQNLLAWQRGEYELFETIGNSLGLSVTSSYRDELEADFLDTKKDLYKLDRRYNELLENGKDPQKDNWIKLKGFNPTYADLFRQANKNVLYYQRILKGLEDDTTLDKDRKQELASEYKERMREIMLETIQAYNRYRKEDKTTVPERVKGAFNTFVE